MKIFYRSKLLSASMVMGIIVGGGLLAGCTRAGSTPKKDTGGSGQQDSITFKTDNGSATFQNNKQGDFGITGQEDGNNFNVGNNSLPQDWPNDLPRLSNASIVVAGSNEDNDKGTIEYSVTYNSKESLGDLFDTLKHDLLNLGWQITNEFNTSASTNANFKTASLNGKKGDNKAVITVSSGFSANPTEATVVIVGTYKK